jgi:hypothetical protein
VRYQNHLSGLPDWAVDLLTWRPLYLLVAPSAIAVELFVGIGLWWPRTRLVALWLAVVFHLSIEISASVEVFSLAAIAALAIWATPSTRDRVVRVPAGATADDRAIRLLDWFGRFRVERSAATDTGLTVVDRDGSVLTGRAAEGLVLTRLPLTFPVAAPVVAVWRLRRRGQASDGPGSDSTPVTATAPAP